MIVHFNSSDNQRANRNRIHERTRQTGGLRVVLQVNGEIYKTEQHIQREVSDEPIRPYFKFQRTSVVTSIQMMSRNCKLRSHRE
jgi:sulfur carrier protein ThiS